MPTPTPLSCFLRSRRAQLGLTQGVVAARAGIGEVRLSRLERADRGPCTLREAVRLAEALRVPVETLAALEGAQSAEPPRGGL